MSVIKITRRTVLLGLGGATAVAGGAGLWLGIRKIQGERFRKPVQRGLAFTPSVYLAIEPSGEVTVWLIRSEMGQGVSTALPMLIAEELDADWSKVRVEQAVSSEEFDYGQLFTAASSSVSSQWIELRRAGASAREMLVKAAASKWRVPVSECVTKSNFVRHPQSGRSEGYGNLAELAARQRVPIRPDLKDPAQFRIIGKPVTRIDLKSKITGKATYGMDVQVPQMLRAVVARPPDASSTLASFDAARSLKVPGVIDVVVMSFGVAVVARTTFEAFQGRDVLEISWTPGSGLNVSDCDISERLAACLTSNKVAVARDDGNALATLAKSNSVYSSTYELPYLAHASMEPMNCTALVIDGRCEVWAPTQAPHGARKVAAQAAKLPVERVTVNVTQLGGGFGRRASHDFVFEAVSLARLFPKPIQVVWSREDDFRHSPHREASIHELRATVDDAGRPAGWYHRVVTATPVLEQPGAINIGAVMGARDVAYDIPNVRVEWCGTSLPIPTTIWRSVGYSYNTFAVESFVDELAYEAKVDPVEFRRRLLNKSSRLYACLNKVVSMCNWSKTRSHGRHLGVSVYDYSGTCVAQVAEVINSSKSVLRVKNVWCAVDCGMVVNPDTVTAQVEGGIVFGLAAAMTGRLSVVDNVIQEDNFHEYVLPRIDEVPEIRVEIVASAEPPNGVGEVGVPGIAPAVTNAVFSLTGTRLKKLPILKGVGQSADESLR